MAHPIGAASPVILHVLPYDEPRGAQVYARALRDRLDGRLGRHRLVTLFAAPPAVLHEDYALGVRLGPLRTLGFDPRAVSRLRRLLKRVRPAAIVAHGGESMKYIILARPQVPVVYYHIGVTHETVHHGWRRLFYRQLVRRVAVAAGVSDEVLDDLHRVLGIAPDRTVLITNGRDSARFACPPRAVGPAASLLCIGELDGSKRPEWFVDVVRGLRDRGLNVNGRLVGAGHRFEELRERAQGTGVELLGRRSDVPELLAAADVLIFPGRPPEGMPGVLIEAGLAGLPVVTTNVPGAASVVEDGMTGYVVDVNDPGALLARAEMLVRDPALRRQLGDAAQQRCNRLFSLDASVTRWTEILVPLLPVLVGS